MTDADRQRLAAILGMLGSEHQGERDNAARQAEAFRRQHGLTWMELIQGKYLIIPKVVYVDRTIVKATEPEHTGWRRIVMAEVWIFLAFIATAIIQGGLRGFL